MLKEIFALLRPGEILLLLGFSLLALLANLGLLGAAAWLISSAALLPPLYALTLGITAVRALGIGRALLRYGERYFTHKSAFNVLGILRLRLYDTASSLTNFPQSQKIKSTFLSDMLTGASILRDFLLRGMLPPLSVLLAVLLISFLLLPLLSWAVLLLPALYLCHCLPLWLTPAANSSDAYRSRLLDFAQGSHELLLAGSLETASKKLDKAARHWQKNLLQENLRKDKIDFLLGIFRSAVFLLLFCLLIDSLQQNLISGVTLSLWLLVLLALFSELAVLPAAARHFRQAQAASGWLQQPQQQVVTSPATAAETLLQVSGLSFHYPQGLPVFSPLDFSITAGCHTAIIGDSGSGKTTLACLLAGLWQPTAGTISRRQTEGPFLSTIPQGSFLFAASIRENFQRLHPAITEEEIMQALEIAQLKAVVSRLPQSIDEPLGENACYLSGGERNRLASALILASHAPLLLFDEPTAGLDRKTADKLIAAIIDRSNLTGQTVILITHDLPQVARFPQVINLSPRSQAAAGN